METKNKQISIKGINRVVGDNDIEDGYSLELLNLRPEATGLKIIGQYVSKSADLYFLNIHAHELTTQTNYIGIQKLIDGDTIDVCWFNHLTGEVIAIIHSFPIGTELEYQTMKNMLIICDITNIKRYVYIFENGSYNLFYYGFEDIDIQYTIEQRFKMEEVNGIQSTTLRSPKFKVEGYDGKLSSIDKTKFVEVIQSAFNKIIEEYPKKCYGYFFVCFNLTLYDGSETGMFGFQIVKTRQGTTQELIDAGWTEPYTTRANTYPFMNFNAYAINYPIVVAYELAHLPEIVITTQANTDILKHKETIKNINLYVSKPIIDFSFDINKFDIKTIGGNDTPTEGDNYYHCGVFFKEADIKELNMPKTLLYKNKSWNITEFAEGIEHTIEFGGDVQTTSKTMEVTASSIERAGKMMLYNNRLHFYNSKARLTIPSIDNFLTDFNEAGVEYNSDVYVYIRLNDETKILKYTDVKLHSIIRLPPHAPNLKYIIIYPDSRAYKIVFYQKDQNVAHELNLYASPAYNYSYAYGNNTLKYIPDFTTPVTDDKYTEDYQINVTANGNPLIFPVEHSYLFDGKITNIGVATDQLSETQIGLFPVNVFTTKGIYALQQGTGTVLYSNIVPINDDVAQPNSLIKTKFGQIYIANNSIFLLRGRHNKKLSLPLEGLPQRELINLKAFKQATDNKLISIYNYISFVDFREYIKNAILSYSTNTFEIIVSNPEYSYSYVYNFLQDCWYKISQKIKQLNNGQLTSLIDVKMTNESTRTVLTTIYFDTFIPKQAIVFNSVKHLSIPNLINLNIANYYLYVDGVKIAEYYNQYNDENNIENIIINLIANIDYLQYNNYKIYSSKNFNTLTIKKENENIIGGGGVSILEEVFIPQRGVGATIVVGVGSFEFEYTIKEDDTKETIFQHLAEIIYNEYIFAVVEGEGNDMVLRIIHNNAFAEDNRYIQSNDNSVTFFLHNISKIISGNYDTNYLMQFIALEEQKQLLNRFLAVTRPIKTQGANIYTNLKRLSFNLKAILTGNSNISIYVYASNNLIDWQCVIAQNRQKCSISVIQTERVAKEYKYYVIVIDGVALTDTELSYIIYNYTIANSAQKMR